MRYSYWCVLRWFLVALAVDIVVPGAFVKVSTGQLLGFNPFPRMLADSLESIWLGWLCVQVSIAVLFGSLHRAALKNRLAISLATVFALVLALMCGLRLAFGFDGFARAAGFSAFLLVASLVAYALGFALLSAYRWRFKWTLSSQTSEIDEILETPQIRDYQVSVRYLMFFATAIVAALALVKAVVPERTLALTSLEHALFLGGVILIGIGLGFFVVFATISAIRTMLAVGRLRVSLHVAWLVLFVTLFPAVLVVGAGSLPASIPKPTSAECFQVFVFFISYILMLLIVLRSLRSAGLRMVRGNDG